MKKFDYVIEHLPGTCFVHADVCAPTDAELFSGGDGAVRRGRPAWNLLQQSDKVRQALTQGESVRFGVRPFRRMAHAREFRLFVHAGVLSAVSQRFLGRYHPRLHRRADELWRLSRSFIGRIAEFLPAPDMVVDVYLTASGKLMLLDLNTFGPPTDPLLLRTWECDWAAKPGLKLLPRPTQLGGEVQVSF